MRNLLLLVSVFSVLLISCGGAEEDIPGGSTSSFLPFFEYQIDSDPVIRIDCSEIKFEGDPNYFHKDVMATSQSVKNTFTYNFPSWTSDMDTVQLGDYPVLAYQGYAYDVPFHISLKAPKTKGGTDYFISLDAETESQKNEIISIEKKGIENSFQVYYIAGKFTLTAKNIKDEVAIIKGSYQFKLLLVVK